MIKTLFVNGCSWTEGHLLHLDPTVHNISTEQGYTIDSPLSVFKDSKEVHYPYREIYDQHNWAGVIANELHIPNIINYAVGAASNDRILRTTTEYVKHLTLEQKQETLVVIGWTIPDRAEIYLNDKQGRADYCSWNATQRFSDIDRIHELNFLTRIDKLWEQYVMDVFDYHSNIQRFFQHSYLLANLLENNGIKYYFFNSFPLFFGIEYYQPYIERFNHDLETYTNEITAMSLNTDFFNFIGENDDLRLPDNHPNKLGHAMWANQILKDMRAQNII